MQDIVSLTVSEAKRLIAKAVAALPEVVHAKRDGILVVSTGSTNAYVAEEILEKGIAKRGFLTGRYSPAKPLFQPESLPERIPDLILQKGEPVSGKTKFQIVDEMGPMDVFIKGANALNYDRNTAGVAIGDPKGGTVGGVLGTLTGRKIPLIVPVGLEKLVAHDIVDSWKRLNSSEEREKGVTGLFPVFGKIVTELEAVDVLFGVRAIHVGAGGVFGAEGGTCLLLEGERKLVEKAKAFFEKDILGEPPY